MKEVSIFLIKQYQKLPVKSHGNCKYLPTCSNYAIDAITTYGFIKGWYLTIKRILRCNPFSKGGIDPVPKKEKKMKNQKKLFKIILLVLSASFLLSGCLKRDDMEGINIITTVYPLEYVTAKLYGNNSIINSIYPDGINIAEYKISSKEYKDHSKQDLFVYNGLSSDKDIALNLVNKNKNILIMDANFGMEIQYGLEELWLNPSNLLMISQNIKNNLIELIDSKYIKDEITESYNDLKVELSELDAEIKSLSEKSNNKILVVASPSLQYLSKYGFEVILINDDAKNEKNVSRVNHLIENQTIKNVYILENEQESKILKQLKNNKKVSVITIDNINNINDEERDNKENYITLMKKNIEQLKKGI